MTDQSSPDTWRNLDPAKQQKLKSAVFDTLVAHLQQRSDVQNIDLMNLAGFCRNCLSRWLVEAAEAHKIELTMPDSRRHVYGMDHEQWKQHYQKGPPQKINNQA